MCHAVTNAGADFIKTSTGFGTAGATMEDVLLMKEHIGAEVKIKAAEESVPKKIWKIILRQAVHGLAQVLPLIFWDSRY